MPTLREYEQVLQRDPASEEAYLHLRTAYREAGKFDRLVALYECRAQAIAERDKAAELFYLAAEARLDHLADPAGAEVDLAHAVDRDPMHLKAARRLKDIYRTQGRTAEVMTMIEVEAAALARKREPALEAAVRAEIAEFETQHIARIERALGNPATRNDVTADQLKLLDSARRVYRALDDYKRIVRLFELELGATTDAKRRAEIFLGLGRVLGEKLGDLPGAAQKIGEVVRLRPRDDRALEALAAVYANPKWPAADGAERAAVLFLQVARRRHEAGDLDGALAILRKGLGAAPGHPESSEFLERILYEAGRLTDLDRYYRERSAAAASPEEKMDFLFKRAQLAEGDLDDQAEALRIYEEIVAIEPPGGPAAQHLAELYLARQDYAKLATVRERQLEALTEPGDKLALLGELAALYKDRLGDREQAAVYLHAILQIDPVNAEALQSYADYFRARGDWKELVDLLEFSVEHAQGGGATAEELAPRLEEIASVAESRLKDGARALAAWQRLEALAPAQERAREAQKRILQRDKRWDQMAELLEREAAAATDPAQRVEGLRRLARMYVEKLGQADRAAAAYEEILRLDPRDMVALRALVTAYEQAERWADLAQLLRRQLETADGRSERLNLLRRLLALHDERLSDARAGEAVAAEILELVPGDRDALARLERMLEKAGDTEGLIRALELHARVAAAADEKVRVLRRVADLLVGEVVDLARAADAWERVLALVPGDPSTLASLVDAYGRLGRPENLAQVLELQIQSDASDLDTRATALRALARLCGETLTDPARARWAWEELVRVAAADEEALEALTAIYRTAGQWKALAAVLERRLPLIDDPASAVELALYRAEVLERNLADADRAARAFEQILAELDPRSRAATDGLRRLAEAKGDWARVAGFAERQLALAEDAGERAVLAQDIGRIWRDRLDGARKAMGWFERAVELAPGDVAALRELAALYADLGESARLVAADERLLAYTEDADERRRLCFEIAVACDSALRQPALAFDWYRRWYQESPDDDTLARLEALAETHGLTDDLLQVYGGEAALSDDPAVRLEAAFRVAELCESRLRSPARAFAALREALPAEPEAERLLPALERLAGETGDWPGLLDVYARVARGRTAVAERIDLLRRRASVRETRQSDASGALDEMLRSFALEPDSDETQQEILRLAEASGRWEDALGVQAQLFWRAGSVEEKVRVARRAAELVEDKLKDRIRAFRAYLNAFRMAPDDEQIVLHLWRLAAAIGRYEEPASVAEMPREGGAGGERTGARTADGGRSATPPAAAAGEPSPDAQASAEDMESAEAEAEAGAEAESEEELGVEDLDDVSVEIRDAGADGGVRTSAVEGGQVSDNRGAGVAPGPPAAAQAQAFATPWEELARAYELLPAPDDETGRRYLKCVADIWERGARDVDRALETLERALRLDREDAEIRGRLDAIGTAHGRWDDVCGIYQRLVQGASREEAVSLHRQVAAIREQLGDRQRAEAAYQAILVMQGDDETALDHLEGMARGEERWADLAGILDRQTAGVAFALPPEVRRRKWLDLADLYETRLERPYEAIDTLERLVASLEEDGGAAELRTAMAGLGRLYGRVGMWQKAVGALAREIDLAADARAARDLRRRMAEICERELGRVAEAAQAYESILSESPDDEEALLALDRLHQGHGQFEALQEVLGRRAELAVGQAKVDLVRRRARILEEKLRNPDAAAACIRGLGAAALEDEELTAALLRNLRSAGLAHEALRVLEQRIEMLGGSKGDRSAVAALHLQIATLHSEELSDLEAARRSVKKALKAAPGDPGALGALARLHLKENDFGAYADALVRQAEALAPAPEAEPVWLEAGAVYRDQLRDAAKARAAFERAVEAQPRSADAMRALAALLVAEGENAAARELYKRQLELVDTPSAKAAVLTDLARALWEKPGDGPECIRQLDQALDLDPDHVPAIVTMADIYYKEQQWVEAERRLAQALRRLRGPSEQAVTLHVRLAEIHERMGRIEEAHRQLVEADRIAPGRLPVRIALAENRLQARRWHEAANLYEGIADHPDAALYPDEVAQALGHGAQAENKVKRPERAVAMYQAALRFRPDDRVALRALADLALERGEPREAAQYLGRLAESSVEPGERVLLFEKLGDLRQGLGDTAGAREAFEKAVASLEAPSDKDMALLEKTLAAQRAAGAGRGATETALRMAELAQSPRERRAKRREVAALLEEEGDAGRASDVLEKILDEDAEDEDALHALVRLRGHDGKRAGLEAILSRSMPLLPPVASRRGAPARRADLWETLGGLRGQRDADGAIAAYEQAVAVEPERVSARAALADLYGSRPDRADAATRNQSMLVAADLTRADALRALAQRLAGAGRTDAARCCAEVLDLLGLASKEDRAFLAAHPLPVQRPEDPYGGVIEERDRVRNLAHPEARILAEVFASLYEAVPGLGKDTLEGLGVTAQDKISPVADLDVGKVFGQAAKALANQRPSLYVSPDRDFDQVITALAPPPAIVVGQGLAQTSDHGKLRFMLGRAIELARPEYILAAHVAPREFAQLFSGVLKAFHPRHARWRPGDKGAEHAVKLKKALPYRVAKRLAELFQEHDATAWSTARWRGVVAETGNRAGLLVCGDLGVAARTVLGEALEREPADIDAEALKAHAVQPGPLRDLLRFAVSEEYFTLRASLGTAVPRAAAA